MRLSKDAILSSAKQGYLSLQVPDIYIGFDTDLADFPDDWFCYLKEAFSGRPAIGKEEGFLYLSRKGYEVNREAMKESFSLERGHDWVAFEAYVAEHFAKIERFVEKRKKTLAKQIAELEAFVP